MTAVLGLSAFFHDSAACLVVDGTVVAAAEEERFSRKKHDRRFPREAAAWCLEHAGIEPGDVDYVAFHEKPFRKLDRVIWSQAYGAPAQSGTFSQVLDRWLGGGLAVDKLVREELPGLDRAEVIFCSHHLSHAAAAFYTSPFEEAAVLTVDGVGEWATTTLSRGTGGRLEPLKEIRFPHSLGMLYSAFTQYLGFRVNDGEYKLMGLAPYGRPLFKNQILETLTSRQPDGSFSLNMSYFGFLRGRTMTNRKFHRLFGGSPREPESAFEQRHLDVAASIQAATDELVLALAREAHRETSAQRLCLAGGVALNCVANARMRDESPFEDVFAFPAAGDAGCAVGAALYLWHHVLGHSREPARDGDFDPFLGPAYDDAAIMRVLEIHEISGQHFEDSSALMGEVTRRLDAGQVVGWFQGRMEFGPRALGNRSILADPRRPDMQSVLNRRIKFRESFRPFAPAVLEERAAEFFQPGRRSPYMLFVDKVAPAHRLECQQELESAVGLQKLRVDRSSLPAITHIDFSARTQTVRPTDNPRFHDLLSAFARHTGCPVVVNTSLNIRGAPIARSPEDALEVLLRTEMDALVMGNILVERDGHRARTAAPNEQRVARIRRRRTPVLRVFLYLGFSIGALAWRLWRRFFQPSCLTPSGWAASADRCETLDDVLRPY